MTDTAPNHVEILKPSSRAEWLGWKRQDVTASQIAALLALHPYHTRLELFLTKSGRKNPDDDLDSASMRRGRLLERLAFQQAADAMPDAMMEHNEYNTYYRDRVLRIGATPDVIVDHPKRGRGVIQLKSVEPSIYRKAWPDGEPPLWIALQALTEAKLVGAQWAAVGVLRVGHAVEFDLTEIPLTEHAWVTLTEAVAEFWAMVDRGAAPPPDYAADAKVIAAIVGDSEPGTSVDLGGDNELVAVMFDREECKTLRADIDKQIAAYDAQIRHKVGTHETAIVGDFRITMKTEHVRGYTVEPRTQRPIRVKRIKGRAAA